MLELIFMLVVITASIYLNTHFASTVTWVNYYVGVIIGLCVSAFVIRIWNQWRKKRRKEQRRSQYFN